MPAFPPQRSLPGEPYRSMTSFAAPDFPCHGFFNFSKVGKAARCFLRKYQLIAYHNLKGAHIRRVDKDGFDTGY